jgi:hypothetical protein
LDGFEGSDEDSEVLLSSILANARGPIPMACRIGKAEDRHTLLKMQRH